MVQLFGEIYTRRCADLGVFGIQTFRFWSFTIFTLELNFQLISQQKRGILKERKRIYLITQFLRQFFCVFVKIGHFFLVRFPFQMPLTLSSHPTASESFELTERPTKNDKFRKKNRPIVKRTTCKCRKRNRQKMTNVERKKVKTCHRLTNEKDS